MNGRAVEIKLSTLWDQGVYKFQQLRDQDYEFVLLLGLSPTVAHSWCVPKGDAITNSIPQHGGAAGSDTRWISFRAESPPPWLNPFGGELDAAVAVLERSFKVL